MTQKTNPEAGGLGAAEQCALGCTESPATSPKDQAKNYARRRPDGDVAASIELLAEMFPRCFAVHEARRRPLKIGIHLDVMADIGGLVTSAELSTALGCYVGNRVYQKRIRAGAARIGLDGEPAGEVTETEAAFAKLQRAAEVVS